MAIDYWLIDATPYRLRYKVHYDGEAPQMGYIPNQGGATPDLRTDALNGATPGAGGIPINDLLRVRFFGYPRQGAGVIAAGGVTQGQARAIMNSEDNPAAPAVLINDLCPRAFTTITAMTHPYTWAADWNVDVDGDPICELRVEAGAVECWALLDIWVRHTFAL